MISRHMARYVVLFVLSCLLPLIFPIFTAGHVEDIPSVRLIILFYYICLVGMCAGAANIQRQYMLEDKDSSTAKETESTEETDVTP